MKKFLLSIFAVLFAFAGAQAEEVTLTCGTEITATTGNFLNGKLSLSCDKNSASSAPAYNSSSKELRLYYGSGAGCSVTLKTDDTIKITGIELVASSTSYTPAVNYFVDGGSAIAGTWSSTKMTISGIEATETFMFQNANTSNKQLRIKSIKVTYEAVAGAVETAKLPTVSEENGAKIALGTEITITPAPGNTVQYTIDDSDEFVEITEPETIVADVAGVMSLHIVSICGEQSVEDDYVYTVMPEKPIISAAENLFEESLEVSIEAEDGEIYYTLDGNDPTDESTPYEGAFTITETTTVKAIAVVNGVASEVESAKYSKKVPGQVIDVLTCSMTGATGTTYVSWSGRKSNTNAMYAGNSAKHSSGAIQMRTTNSNSGIVTTSSGGKAVKVLVVWNSSTTVGRTLDIYGKNTAYSSAADLYVSGTQGTKLGSIVCGTSTEIEIEGDYEYIGIRSKSGALYVDEVQITWSLPYHTLSVTEAGYATLYFGATAIIPKDVEAYTVTAANDGWVSLTQVTGVVPSQTGIIVKAAAGDYKFFLGATATADVTGNLLSGSAYNKNVYEEAYVLGNVDGVVGLYKAQMTDGVWLNNANKAYLPASAVPNKSAAFYGFDWNGTTGIDEITDNREQSTVIYDLAGRRVDSITAPGIYIVNGVKRVIR